MKVFYLVEVKQNGRSMDMVFFETMERANQYAREQLKAFYYDARVSIHLVLEGPKES